MIVYVRHRNSSTLFLTCVGRGGQVLEALWNPSATTKEEKGARKSQFSVLGKLHASGAPTGEPLASHKANWHASGMPSLESRQWLANWRATGEHNSQLRVLTLFSAYKKGKLDIFKGGRKNTNWDISRAHFGAWRAWRTLGKLGIQVGSLERFELSSFVVVYLLPSSSYLFNELLHSFRVCFIYIYV